MPPNTTTPRHHTASPTPPHPTPPVQIAEKRRQEAGTKPRGDGDELCGGGGARDREGGVRHRRVGVHRVLDRQAAPRPRLHRPRHRAGHRSIVPACLPPISSSRLPVPRTDSFPRLAECAVRWSRCDVRLDGIDSCLGADWLGQCLILVHLGGRLGLFFLLFPFLCQGIGIPIYELELCTD
uniref:Uncharacterized protein n=1 Tax=Arundo donax TaxID=35708 RepID=A0A0A9CU90_ARUDO